MPMFLLKKYEKLYVLFNSVPVISELVGWLVWVYRPFETVFQSISGRLPEREKEKRKGRREKKCLCAMEPVCD